MAFEKKRKNPKVKTATTSRTLPKNFFSAFGKDLLLKADDETRKFAKDLAKEAKSIIRDQRYDWKSLSDAYLKQKERKGLDTRIYIATKTYVNKGIGYFEKGGYSFVGPKPGTHKPSGLPYAVLARILEFGTWSIPARPLWRPLLSVALRRSKHFRNKFVSDARKDFNKKLKGSVKKKARKS